MSVKRFQSLRHGPVASLSVIALILILVSGCASTPRTVEYDPSVDFSQYRTFAWAPPEARDVRDPILDSQLLDRRMGEAVRQVLEAKGLSKVEADEADLLITYHTSSRERLTSPHVRVRLSYGYGYPYYPMWYRHPYHSAPYYHSEQRSFQEGTLIIDVVDRSRNELVWRGWRAGEVRQTRFRDEQLRQQVERIFSAFPPASR